MAKLLLVSVFCICLLIQGIKFARALGQDCSTDATVCTGSSECSGGTCKTKLDAGGDCNAANTFCDSAASLSCEGGKCQKKLTAVDGDCSAENTVCDPTTLTCQGGNCKKKVGQVCTSADVDPKCIENAECPKTGTTANTCTCKAGFAASEDNTKCGAMGVAASMLLIVATYLTSLCL